MGDLPKTFPLQRIIWLLVIVILVAAILAFPHQAAWLFWKFCEGCSHIH